MDKDFLSWHYTQGLQFFIRRWRNTLQWIIHYFSMPLLLTSLFSSYKRLSETKSTGINIDKYFQKLTFNLISRGVGAVTRLTLFGSGLVLYVLTAITGILGIGLWYIFPPMGYPFYSKYQKHPNRYAEKLKDKLLHSSNLVNDLFDNEAGSFVLKHLNLALSDIDSIQLTELQLSTLNPNNYTNLLDYIIGNPGWPEDQFKRKGIIKSDWLTAASWWDRNRLAISEIEPPIEYGRPGIGLELLFGFTPTLNLYTSELVAPKSFQHHLIGRKKVVSRIERALTAGNSVVVVGTPGVGKKTVVLEFADKAGKGQLGHQMAYRRILDFDYNFLLSEAVDLNTKKIKLSQALAEASAAGNIILVIRDIYRLTNPDVEGLDFTDIFEKFLEKKELKIIALATQMEYERYLSQNLRIKKFMEVVEVEPPAKEEAMQILVRAAEGWEAKKTLTITVTSLRAILEGSDRYLTETPFPEKAIELLDSVITYKDQKGGNLILADDVQAVLSEKTGISMARLTETEKAKLANLEDIIHEGLINQEAAISLIAKSLRARSAGVRDENRPIGSFLFLGPTGVGKTQTAKVLSKVYYGSETQMIRFDMAEFATNEGITRLIGSQQGNTPGVLTTAIKNRPASLLLLDEIEKAPPEVFNLLLTLLDEGYITDAFGRKISARHLFVIATSNAGAEYIREQVSQGAASELLQKNVLEYIQQQGLFSPELLNRFDGVVVFEPLTHEHLVEVARLMLEELSKNLVKRNIFLHITDEASRKVSIDGYDPTFGARPMRRVIDLVLGDLIGKAILKGDIKEGDQIEIIPGPGKNDYSIKTIQTD